MAMDITRELRTVVIERAQHQCEYCLKPDDHALNPHRHEVDHVLAEKHGGSTDAENLAYACFHCNRHKGADIASLDPHTQELIRLFHPRTQRWTQHFQLTEDGSILGQTAEGRATARLLRMNDPERIRMRADLIAVARLSPSVAHS
jgi:HNH endonuclease